MSIRYLFISYVAATIVTVISLSSAQATVLYQVLPTGTLNTAAADSAVSKTAFDNFILTDAATITSISWLGTGSLPTDTYRVGLYDSTSQDPVATPFFEIVSTAGGTANAQDPATRDYEVDLGAGAFLVADTTYWLSIRNVTTGRFFWLWKGDAFGSYISRDNRGNDNLAQLSLFFTLEGELGGGNEPPLALAGPPAATILGLGLIGIAAGRRRHHKINSDPTGQQNAPGPAYSVT
ncbi:MAG: hypothetical protein ACI9JL_002581 [Paracoccaceae bacterium]|jgi:hypothetical protein